MGISLQGRIAALSQELYQKDWEELEGEVAELVVALKRRKRGKRELAAEAVALIKKAMVRALMEGNDRAFYSMVKSKRRVEELVKGLDAHPL